MKSNPLIGSLALIFFFFAGLSGCAIAGDTVYIKVSCSIPAVPGVNAPANEFEKEATKEDVVIQETARENLKATESEILLAEVSETEGSISYTIYSR